MVQTAELVARELAGALTPARGDAAGGDAGRPGAHAHTMRAGAGARRRATCERAPPRPHRPTSVHAAPTAPQERTMTVRTVAMLTAGGLAPCLSSAVGGLIQRYTEIAPDVRIIAYTNGYAGLLAGDYDRGHARGARARPTSCTASAARPIGNSRVKLTNVADCVKRGLVQEGQDPLHVAAEQLTADGVDVLHTIGGDDTNTTAADLAAYLHENDYELTVVGLPKTIDNDVVPIRQSLGAWTAAEQGSVFAQNIIAEHTSNPRMLIVHEVMGRNCGWLTAATAEAYHQLGRRAGLRARHRQRPAPLGRPRGLRARAPHRPRTPRPTGCARVMDELGCVNIFLSEGAGVRRGRRRARGRRPGGARGPVRPRAARQGQPGRVVRQAVRRAARRREDDGAEVGLLRALGRRQRPRPAP